MGLTPFYLSPQEDAHHLRVSNNLPLPFAGYRKQDHDQRLGNLSDMCPCGPLSTHHFLGRHDPQEIWPWHLYPCTVYGIPLLYCFFFSPSAPSFKEIYEVPLKLRVAHGGGWEAHGGTPYISAHRGTRPKVSFKVLVMPFSQASFVSVQRQSFFRVMISTLPWDMEVSPFFWGKGHSFKGVPSHLQSWNLTRGVLEHYLL